MEEKKKKKKGLLVALLTVLLAGGLVTAGITLGPKIFKGSPEETGTETEATDPSREPEAEYRIYYNLERDKYDVTQEGGMVRQVNREDGYYHILMAVDTGRPVQVRVADKTLVAKIDRNLFMGLIFDENNICTDIVDINDLISEFYYERWYVMERAEDKENTVFLNSNAYGRGLNGELTWDKDTKLVDVSGFSGAQGNFASYLREDDRIIGIKDKEGKLTHVFIIERTEESATYKAYCEHCQEEVKWKGWNSGTSLPVSTARYSHFYLTQNVILTQQQNIQKDQHICLDLKGHSVSGGMDLRVVSLHNTGAELSIFDTSEEKTGVLRSWGEGDEGSCVWVRYGTFNLYGGTLDASQFKTWKSGTCVAVGAGNTMNMYGGTVIGGVNEGYRRQTAEGKYTNSGGLSGSIHLNGTLNLYDGVIRDGEAKESYYTDDKGKEQNFNGYGGNIYMGSRAVLNMYGGEITGGKSYRSGGNIAMEGNYSQGYGAVLNMYGGKITNGTCSGSGVNGGNISVGRGCTFNLIDGEISGGTSQNCAGNVYINGTFNMKSGIVTGGVCNKDGKPNTDSTSYNLFYVRGGGVLEGGQVDGGVWVQHVSDAKTDVTLSGDIKITGQKYNVYMAKEELITVEGLKEGANIGVYANGIFSNPTDAANRAYFHSDVPGAGVIQTSGKLAVGQVHCECCGTAQGAEGHTCSYHVYQAWTNATSLPVTSGYYFLTKDVTLDNQRNIQENQKVVLCLNGHTVTGAEDRRVYSLHYPGAELVITDCKKTGKIQCRGTKLDEGGCVWVRYGSFTLYNATLSAEGANANKSGTAVNVGTGNSFTMMSGTIIGGSNTGFISERADGSLSYIGGSGGAVYTNGNFTMNGGTIRDGRALTGTQEIQGSEKSFGGYGGNVYVGAKGVFTMNGGELKDGYAQKYSGNVSTDEGVIGSTVVINGGTISGGTCNMNETLLGNLCMMNHTTLTVNGGTIDGKAGIHSEGKEMFVTFAKDAKITNNGGGFSIPTGVRVSLSELSENAEIFVTAGGEFTELTAEENAKYIKTVNGDEVAVKKTASTDTEGILAIGRMQCACGGVLEGKTVDGEEHHCADHLEFFGPWNDGANLPSNSGNYYLTKDVSVTGQRRVSGESADAPMNLVIDLNGHTIGGTSRTFIIGYPNAGELTLCDSSEGKTGVITRKSYAADDVMYVYPGGKLTLYGVKVDGSNGKGNCCTLDSASKTTVVAYETEFIGARRDTGSTVGGNLRVGENAVATLTDCVVRDGYCQSGGGNINVGAGTLNLIRTKVSGGQAPNAEGGNIRAYGTVLIEDSEITGGVAKTGAGVHCGFTGVTVKGTTVITGNGVEKAADNDSNISVGSGKKVVFEGIDPETQKFSLSPSGTGVVAEVKGEALDTGKVLAAITSEVESTEFTAEAKTGVVEISAVSVHKHCICGGTLEGKTVNGVTHVCEKVEFAPLTDANNIKNLVSGNYYLPQDMEITSQQGIKGGAKIVIDLNGHTLKMTHRFMIGYPDEGQLTITDCSKTQSGKMVMNHNVQECMFYLHQQGTLNIYAGTMDGSSQTCPTTVNNLNLIRQANGSPVLNIYGGTLIGPDNLPGKQGNGTVLYASNGTVNIYGGTLKGNNAHNGATMYVAGVPLNIYGGEIIGGTASIDGGTVYFSGSTMTMTGGIIRDGIAQYPSEGGGNIFSGSSGTVKLLGGTVSGGQAVQGGNIRTFGSLYLKDVTITGGVCSQNGGGIYMGSYNNNVLEISGNTVITGNKYKNGTSELSNNLFLASGRKAVLKDAGENLTFGITENDAKTSVVEGAAAGMENTKIFMDKTKYQLTYDNGTLRIIDK